MQMQKVLMLIEKKLIANSISLDVNSENLNVPERLNANSECFRQHNQKF